MNKEENMNQSEDSPGADPENQKPKNQKPKKRRLANYFLAAGILLFALYLCLNPIKNWQQERRNESLRQLAEKETQTTVEASGMTEPAEAYLSPIDFDALKKINPDIVAWLKIPGTQIDYPVVQTKDNETYLKKTFDGKQRVEGAVYLDCDSDSDFMGSHSIVYGHNMKNKTMFADIIKFKDEAFFKEHREIILYTPERELHLQTIAALYGDADGEKRRTKFEAQEELDQYIDSMTKACSFRELPEKQVDRLYSFVTCSYEFNDARTILYAVDGKN